MIVRSRAQKLSLPTMFKRDKRFQPCPLDAGEEAFPNGIFEFNITRLLAHITPSDLCLRRSRSTTSLISAALTSTNPPSKTQISRDQSYSPKSHQHATT